MKVLALLFFVIVAGLAASSPVSAQEREETFQEPDVRDDYCGVFIEFQYCRCAFHNEAVYCDAMQTNQSAANEYVITRFKNSVAQRIEAFALNCIANNGDWRKSRRTCVYPGPDGPQTIAERFGLPNIAPRPPLQSPRAVGKVVYVQDCQTFLYMGSFNKWKGPIQGGQPLYANDVVFTGGGECSGTTKVTLYSQSGQDTIDIAPDTWLEFPHPPDPSQIGFWADLKRGAVQIYEKLTGTEETRPVSPFNVRTPTVVTGRRGTEYLISYDDATGASEILVIEGEVDVTPVGAGVTTTLAANEGATYLDGTLETHEISSGDWDDALDSAGLDGEHITVAPEDLIPPEGPPVEYTRAELVGDLSFLDDQFGGHGFPARGIFVGFVIAGIFVLMAGTVVIAPMLLLPPESRLRR